MKQSTHTSFEPGRKLEHWMRAIGRMCELHRESTQGRDWTQFTALVETAVKLVAPHHILLHLMRSAKSFYSFQCHGFVRLLHKPIHATHSYNFLHSYYNSPLGKEFMNNYQIHVDWQWSSLACLYFAFKFRNSKSRDMLLICLFGECIDRCYSEVNQNTLEALSRSSSICKNRNRVHTSSWKCFIRIGAERKQVRFNLQ